MKERVGHAIKYWFKYIVSETKEGFFSEEVVRDKKEGYEVSASDSILIVTIHKDSQNKFYSAGFTSTDGFNNGKPISSDEFFDVFCKMAEIFKYRDDISEWKKKIAFETYLKIKNFANESNSEA